MKQIFLFCLVTFCLAGSAFAQAADTWKSKADPDLRAALDRGETVNCLLIFKEQADLRAARQLKTKAEKGQYAYQTLVETADRTQINARRVLTEARASANSFYLVNAIAVEHADRDLLQRLAILPEISHLSLDPDVHFDGPAAAEPAAVGDRNTIEWGVAKIHAPEVWALGYTGQGITVGGADTGYDWTHPALQAHYRGYNLNNGGVTHSYNWHDAIHENSALSDTSNMNPCGLNLTAPCDDNSHGTHTMGTMTGDDGQGNQIGVAPGAKWIACRNMERGNGKPSSYIECFQWFIAPTNLNGLNPDPNKAPDVINNSWYCATSEGCTSLAINELMREAVINLRNSGVVVVVSNGNFGPSCASTYGPPAYFEESFSIGATRADDFIASFSSRGPVTIDSSFRLKPNVSAPGQDVRSSVPNNGYA
ncbi:MAG: S8 family serine peptidase, partial [Saprospiraceae bacterium]